MDLIRVRAPSHEHAQRLIAALDGTFHVAHADGDGDGRRPANEVALLVEKDTAGKLVELFDALQRWLSDGDLEAVQIGFGDRVYTLFASVDGDSDGPVAFLLERTIQLQAALDSRVVIEQAKGILAERHSIDPEAAFEQMRREARSRRMRLHTLAAGIVATVAVTARDGA